MDKDAVSVSKSTFELATHAKDQLQLNIFRNNANLVKQHESIPLPGRPHNKDSFDFEALPPELRNQIYSHVLTLPPGSHFRFSRFSGRTRRTQNKPVSCPFETSATIRVLNKRKTRGVREHSMKSVAPSQAVNACLLLTNRTVHQEATPILYGSNRFVFQSALTAGDFFAWVGDQYKAMRDIEVMQYGTALHGTLLTQTLSRLAHIQNLNIVLYSDDNLKALCSQVRAVVRGGVQAACDCARAGGHCACRAARNLARFNAISIGPKQSHISGDQIVVPSDDRRGRAGRDAEMAGEYVRRQKNIKRRMRQALQADGTLRLVA